MAGLNLPWRKGGSTEAPATSSGTASSARTLSLNLWLAVTLIVLLAFGVRIYNTNWDVGSHAHPDERHITLVSIALELPSGPAEYFNTGDSPLNPYNLENTGSFVYGTLPVFVTKVAAVVAGRDDYDGLVIVGRQLTAVFAAATVLFVFLAGRRLYGPAVGLMAAVLLAAAPLAIQHAHFFVVDTHLTFFMAAAFYFSVRVLQEGQWSDYALAGLMTGCAMACKITGGLFLPVLFIAAAVRMWPSVRDAWRWNDVTRTAVLGTGVALLVAFLAFRIAQPYAFDGLVSINDQWWNDQREQERLLGGEVGFPPSVQWIDRTSYLYPLQDMVVWGMGPAFGIAAWAALAFMAYRVVRYGFAREREDDAPHPNPLPGGARELLGAGGAIERVGAGGASELRGGANRELVHLLPLVFVVVYFAFMGGQFSLYMRYFLPLYPVLAIAAGYGLVMLYRQSAALAQQLNRPGLAQAGTGIVAGVLLASLLVGLGYFSIYTRDFTRAEASRWLFQNAAPGAAVAGEEWDEILPMGGIRHARPIPLNVYGLPLYNTDTPAKLAALVDGLDRADFVTVSSNRLMNSLPRNRINYPVSSRYHEMLLSGELGFELVAEFTSYPGLFGIEFPDHRVQESWSSYDHPRVLIFARAPDYSRERLELALGRGPYAAGSLTPVQASGPDLLLNAGDLETQREGGTWTDVFSTSGIVASHPALVWFLALQAFAFAAAPLTLTLFRRLPDRGYLLAKPLGLLLVAYVTWLAVSLKLVPFEQWTIALGLLLVAAASAGVAYRRREDLLSFVRGNLRLIVFCEALFLVAFLAFYLLRMENPDLWHPFRGGEKPMDLAYLTAVVRSTTLPPYDPWFAGGYINYYYLGQFFTATLVKLTTIPPEIAYNLAIPTFFALTVGAAFSVAYNLAASLRGLLAPGATAGVGTSEVGRIGRVRAIPAWSVYACGLLGAFLVAVAGNLDGVGQLVERLSEASAFRAGTGIPVLESAINSAGGAWQVAFHGAEVRDFDFWRSSRMMPPTISITEFPYFSFLFADLHAHMMAIAFQVLAIGTCLALVLRRRAEADRWGDIGLVVLLGLIVGSLRWINSWDYPPFLLLAVAAVVISERYAEGGAKPTLQRLALKAGLLVGLSFLLYQPFMANYRTPVAGIESSPEQTAVHQYLAHFGLFAAFIAVGLAAWAGRALIRTRVPASQPGAVDEGARAKASATGWAPRQGRSFTGLIGAAVVVVAVLSLLAIAAGQPLVAALLPVLALVLALAAREAWLRRPDGGLRLFVLALVALGLGLSMGVDIVVLEGDIVRMNTVFKFYLHVWVLFALAAAFFAWQLVFVYWRPLAAAAPRFRLPRLVAQGAMTVMVLLLMGVSLYPLLATPVRLNDRFNPQLSAGLDGMAYMETAVYNDQNGPIDLSLDLEGIRWMRDNVEGTPAIVEGQAELYRWGGRFSIYTGLPTVVGWDWHQRQQRGDLAFMVTHRGQQVTAFYNNPDPVFARDFLRMHDVRYVIVGQVERYYYHPMGLEKFNDGLGGVLEVAFQNEGLTIYRVLPEALEAPVARGEGAP